MFKKMCTYTIRSSNLSGEMYEAVENYQNGIPESVFDYYSAANLESLGWNSIGRFGFENTYWHPSGRYLTVQIMDCPNSMTEYCVNVWESVDSSNTPPPAPVKSLSAESATTALAALNKITPANNSIIELPTNTTYLLKWSDAGIDGTTDRYQYCIDETDNDSCDSNNWITRKATYSGDGEFTLLVGHIYFWQVRIRDAGVYADGGAGTWWKFTVVVASTFTKTTPANGSAIALPTNTTYLLQWSDAGIASTDRYQYCIDETNNNECNSTSSWITRNSLYSGDGEFTLAVGHTYYWQVRARDANKYANSGSWWSFTIPAADTFTKTTPANGSTISLPATTYHLLEWTALAGIDPADRYQYCIDETNNNTCNSTWITRDSLYSGGSPNDFTLLKWAYLLLAGQSTGC